MSTSERRLLINLRIISALLPHQKLNAKAELLTVEQLTWIPESFYRWFRGDTREICLRRLEELVAEAVLLVERAGNLNDKKAQKKYLTHIYNTVPGFQNLKQTYADDATTVAKIELFIEQANDILCTHNFEPDRMVIMNELPVSDDSADEDTDDEDKPTTLSGVPKRLGPKIGQEQWRNKVGHVLD